VRKVIWNDGTSTFIYGALDSTTGQTHHNNDTGKGVLLTQVATGIITRYIQDLASPLSQVLQTTTDHRLARDAKRETRDQRPPQSV
jgi:hypothetical protein